MEEHLKTMNLCLSFSLQIGKEHNRLFEPSYGEHQYSLRI